MKALGQRSIASIVKSGLAIVWVALLVAAALIAAAGLAGGIALVAMALGWTPPDLVSRTASETEVGTIRVIMEGGERLTWPVLATALLASAVAVGGALVIVSRLRRLFGNFTSGEPFSADNAGHLRVIWITMMVMELSRYAIAAGVSLLILAFGRPEAVDLEVRAPVDLTTWGAILILIVLAEVFREGARLRENDSLTI